MTSTFITNTSGIPASSPQPTYVIALEWEGEQVRLIRDYRYVPYLVNELSLDKGE